MGRIRDEVYERHWYGRKRMSDVVEWTNENKIYILKSARKDLIARSYWGKTPNSLACLDAIIKDYEDRTERTRQ